MCLIYNTFGQGDLSRNTVGGSPLTYGGRFPLIYMLGGDAMEYATIITLVLIVAMILAIKK